MKRAINTLALTASLLGLCTAANAQTAADKEFMSKLYTLHVKSISLSIKADDEGLKAQLPQFEALLKTPNISSTCMEAARARFKMAQANIAFQEADDSAAESKALKEVGDSGQVYDTKREACLGHKNPI